MKTHDRVPHDWRHLLTWLAGFLAISALGLWAFNTLTELAGGPTAQYRHAVAALALLGIARRVLGAPRYRAASASPAPRQP